MAALPAWVPYALMAGGTAMQMRGNDKMEEEQKRILNRSMLETQETQDKANAEVAKEGAAFNPEQRAIDLAAQEQGAFQRAQADLAGTEGIVESATKGNVSGDFLKAKADKAIGEGNRITAIAREAAKARAPGQQMAEESVRRSALAGDLGSAWSAAGGKARAAQLDAQGVDMPGIGQLGQIASLIGSVWAGGMGADASAPTAVGAGTEGMAGYTMPASGGAAAPATVGGAASMAPSMLGGGTGLSGIWGGGQQTRNRQRSYDSMFGQKRNY